MKNRSTNLLISEVVFILLQYLLVGTQPEGTSSILMAIGATVIPFSNAYLFTRYGQGWIQKNQLISMLLVGIFSCLFGTASGVLLLVLILVMIIKNLGTKPKTGGKT